MEDNPSRKIILWFFLGLFMISTILLGWLIRPFLPIIVLALVVTGLFNPINRRLRNIVSDSIASIITCTIIFFVLFVPIVLFAGILSKEAYGLYLMAKGAVSSDHVKMFFENSQILERLNVFLSTFQIKLTGVELHRAFSELGKFVGLFLFRQTNSIASNILAFLANFFFMLIIIYFLLIDGPKLISFIIDLSPLPKAQDEKLIFKFKEIANAILIVNGLGGLIQGTLGGMVWFIFGLNSPFLWGVIMGLLAFLPILGIGMVFIPAALYLVLKGQIAAGVFFFIFYLVLSFGIEYFLKPRIVGQRAKMHTLLVFLSIIGGLKLFGMLGIIYGPLVVTAFLTLNEIYQESYQQHINATDNEIG
jgi:predicted PurR-regulated permease PerM